MTNAEVEQTEPKTLLEELHELDNYLLDRRDRTARSESPEMAYENSARLLRNILNRHSEKPVDQIGVDAILSDLSALDDEFLTACDQHTQFQVRQAYRKAASKVRSLIEKHRIEPEYEWGVKYLNFNDEASISWGFSSDPRLPSMFDNGRERSPQIEDGEIWIGNDTFTVVAVSKRIKPVHTEPWEEYKA